MARTRALDKIEGSERGLRWSRFRCGFRGSADGYRGKLSCSVERAPASIRNVCNDAPSLSCGAASAAPPDGAVYWLLLPKRRL